MRSAASDTNGDNDTRDGIQSNTQARDTKYPDNDVIVSHELRTKIEDLKAQIVLMSDQLGKKANQITQLNEVTQKQAVHIQSLIQENSKLNTKLLPEVLAISISLQR